MGGAEHPDPVLGRLEGHCRPPPPRGISFLPTSAAGASWDLQGRGNLGRLLCVCVGGGEQRWPRSRCPPRAVLWPADLPGSRAGPGLLSHSPWRDSWLPWQDPSPAPPPFSAARCSLGCSSTAPFLCAAWGSAGGGGFEPTAAPLLQEGHLTHGGGGGVFMYRGGGLCLAAASCLQAPTLCAWRPRWSGAAPSCTRGASPACYAAQAFHSLLAAPRPPAQPSPGRAMRTIPPPLSPASFPFSIFPLCVLTRATRCLQGSAPLARLLLP